MQLSPEHYMSYFLTKLLSQKASNDQYGPCEIGMILEEGQPIHGMILNVRNVINATQYFANKKVLRGTIAGINLPVLTSALNRMITDDILKGKNCPIDYSLRLKDDKLMPAGFYDSRSTIMITAFSLACIDNLEPRFISFGNPDLPDMNAMRESLSHGLAIQGNTFRRLVLQFLQEESDSWKLSLPGDTNGEISALNLDFRIASSSRGKPYIKEYGGQPVLNINLIDEICNNIVVQNGSLALAADSKTRATSKTNGVKIPVNRDNNKELQPFCLKKGDEILVIKYPSNPRIENKILYLNRIEYSRRNGLSYWYFSLSSETGDTDKSNQIRITGEDFSEGKIKYSKL